MPATTARAVTQTSQPSTTATLLDRVLPCYEFRGKVTRSMHASPPTIFRALREVTPSDMPLAAALGNVRYLPGRLTGRVPALAPGRSFWESADFDILAEEPGREIVIGSIGRLHDLRDQQFVPLTDLATFKRFQHPDFQKLAISVRAEPTGRTGTTRVIMEHRTLPLGPTARWKFAIYWWLLIRWASTLMGGLLLDATRRRAEAGETSGPMSGRSTNARADPAERRLLRWFYRDRRPTRLGRLVNRASAWATGAGLAPPILLTLLVRGRHSGRLRTSVLVEVTHEGQHYLVSMLGEDSEWVRNVRAADGEAFVKRRGRSCAVVLTELPPGHRAPFLKAYCQVASSGRHHFPIDATAPLSEFEEIAAHYPVFRIDPATRT
jgi:hypothetical protein